MSHIFRESFPHVANRWNSNFPGRAPILYSHIANQSSRAQAGDKFSLGASMKYPLSLAAVAALLMSSSSGLAADSPIAPVIPKSQPSAFAPNWTGPYVGVLAGWHRWRTLYSSDEDNENFAASSGRFNLGGVLGANIQQGKLVLGVEADLSYVGGSETWFGFDESEYLSVKTKWNAHARARIGYDAGNVMPYLAFGLAALKFRGANINDEYITNDLAIGYSVGAGADWRFAPNWLFRAEYLYDGYTRVGNGDTDTARDNIFFKPSMHTLRVALIYMHGLPAVGAVGGGIYKAPVMAQSTAWAGVYAGLLAGGHRWSNTFSSDERNPIYSASKSGLHIAGVVGANVQHGPLVVGAEADIGHAGGKVSWIGDNGDLQTFSTSWNAHVRARIGWDMGNVLPYVGFGLAALHHKSTNVDNEFVTKNLALGYSIGVGADWRFAPNWLVRAEYLFDYYQRVGDGDDSTIDDAVYNKPYMHLLRAGLIYQFGLPAMPAPAGGIYKAPVAPQVALWSGPYVGVVAGVHHWRNEYSSDEDNEDHTTSKTAFNIGGVVGANLQQSKLVLGAEADLSYVGGKTSWIGVDETDLLTFKTKWSGHARARVGWDHGNILPYMAFGLAVLGYENQNVDDGYRSKEIAVGLSAGVGVDWMTNSGWMYRLEYLFDTFQRVGNGDNDSVGDSLFNKQNMHTVRFGVLKKY